MSDYGTHPTRFANLSDNALCSLYRREEWLQLDESMRLDLLQETVNRAALANGEIGACRVEFADLGPTTAGCQSGGVIQLDRNRYVNDIAVMEYNGREIAVNIPDSNIQALQTVLHEDIHAWQNQCLDGTISNLDPKLLEEYQANNFDMSVIYQKDGTPQLGQQYLSGVSPNGGYYLYYLQSTERDAHLYSEMRTMQIVDGLEQRFGTEPSFAAYRANVSGNGFQAVVQQANTYFGTDSVERDINATLQNQFHDKNLPVVSPAVEDAVKNEMYLSLENRLRNENVQDQSQENQNGAAVSIQPAASQPAAPAQEDDHVAQPSPGPGEDANPAGNDNNNDNNIEI